VRIVLWIAVTLASGGGAFVVARAVDDGPAAPATATEHPASARATVALGVPVLRTSVRRVRPPARTPPEAASRNTRAATGTVRPTISQTQSSHKQPSQQSEVTVVEDGG
jgi:hypothetical protein